MDLFAKYFDHTLLKPEATEEDIRRLCAAAVAYGVAAVCVNSRYVKTAKAFLDELKSPGKVAAVVGFPLGAMSTTAKAYEAGSAVREGADEIGMVRPIGAAKSGNYEEITKDVSKVKEGMLTMSIHSLGGPTRPDPLLKVILETGLLTDEEIAKSCEAAIAGGADFLKTSTGFGNGGATVEAVTLMWDTAAGRAKIKASGGIRDLAAARAMIGAGADRLGTSATTAILDEYQREIREAGK